MPVVVKKVRAKDLWYGAREVGSTFICIVPVIELDGSLTLRSEHVSQDKIFSERKNVDPEKVYEILVDTDD